MQKKHASQSGIFIFRIVIAVALCSIGASLGWLSFASTPPTSNITVPSTVGQTVSVTWTGTIPPLTNGTSDCAGLEDTPAADTHTPTVTVPAGIYSTLQAQFTFKITFVPVVSNSTSDEILTVLNPDGSELGSSDAGIPSEIVTGTNLVGGAYKVVACGFTNAQPQPYTGTLTIITCPLGGCSSGGSFGGPDPTTPGSPRYQNFYAPPGSSAEESTSGEFNIGFNPATGRIMVKNTFPIWRLTPPELLTPAKAECCEALWENKDNPVEVVGLDPILWTDQKTGRTFESNYTAGANFNYAYSDNDGDLWVTAGASPPNGGADHESLGSGPLPASLSALSDPVVNQGEYVLYCSQDVLGSQCQRSLDLGMSFGPGVPATGPGTMSSKGCGGLHGHVHVAPDGTAWLPDNSCITNSSSRQGGAISLDAGTTPWTEFSVPGSVIGNQATDPSVAFDENSTAYYCYVNTEAGGNETHAHVAVGKRNGASATINWLRDVDVGASHGIVNVVFPEAVGGSAGRAACGFLGTNVPGSFQGTTFNGDWYLFIATTYDEGQTWVTVNATPNDPVQHKAGVCLGGLGCGAEDAPRNLLDFNEVTVDDKGRVLFGYSDGCVSSACINGTAGNDNTAFMRVARQFGGKGLFASLDTVEPALPKPACLSGTRDPEASYLTWKAPDNGGSDITGYVILRSTTSGTETVIVANTGSDKTFYNDTTADPAVPDYFYTVKAINSVGTGLQSNEIDLQVGPAVILVDSCDGVNVVTDASGDAHNPAPGGQGSTSQADITAVSFSANATTLTTTMKIANLSRTPSTGTTFTSYYVVWTSSDGTTYATEVDVDAATISYGWGPWDSSNNQLSDYNSATGGTFTAGANGTITVPVPRNMIGSPTIPITNPAGTAAVNHPFAYTVAGEGVLGSGLVFTSLMDRAPNSGYGARWAVCAAPQLTKVASRKVHSTAGKFDVELPLVGTRGIECRSGGATNAYTLVYTFDSILTTGTPATTATVSHGTGGGTGDVSSQGIGPNPNQYTVNLINVSNAQHLTVTLDHVHNTTPGADVLNQIGNMDVLVGDVNASRVVNTGDTNLCKAQALQTVTNSNFRNDINASGVINTGDVNIIKQNALTQLPP